MVWLLLAFVLNCLQNYLCLMFADSTAIPRPPLLTAKGTGLDRVVSKSLGNIIYMLINSMFAGVNTSTISPTISNLRFFPSIPDLTDRIDVCGWI